MNKELKKLYGSSYLEGIEQYDFQNHYYFKQDNQEVFGINKTALSNNELVLLDLHYERLDEKDLTGRDIEVLDYLLGDGKTPTNTDYQFIKYILIKPLQRIEHDSLTELITLIQGFLGEDALIFKRQSVIIAILKQELDQDIGDFVDSITSDFYVDLLVYESEINELDETLQTQFLIEFNSFTDLNKTSKLRVTKADLMYNNIVNALDSYHISEIKHYVLGDFVDDQEMLNVVKTFFETNMNISLSAKNCFMHRNTFQNKIEKYIQSTGFNIRQFNEAFIVYLALSL